MSHESALRLAVPFATAKQLDIHFWDFSQEYTKDSPPEKVVFLTRWSRDCDMVESSAIMAIPATEAAIEATFDVYDREYSCEGPYRLEIVSESDARSFSAVYRDRVLEAFENGHPHCVHF